MVYNMTLRTFQALSENELNGSFLMKCDSVARPERHVIMINAVGTDREVPIASAQQAADLKSQVKHPQRSECPVKGKLRETQLTLCY